MPKGRVAAVDTAGNKEKRSNDKEKNKAGREKRPPVVPALKRRFVILNLKKSNIHLAELLSTHSFREKVTAGNGITVGDTAFVCAAGTRNFRLGQETYMKV